MSFSYPKRLRSTAVAAALTAILVTATAAYGQTGGTTAPTAEPTPTTVAGSRAKINAKGKAIPPAEAPARVQAAIRAGNEIRKKPYIYGGGHQSFKSAGYDCSGAVSYVLHAAGVLKSPMPSGSFMNWKKPGKGAWITTYANGGHMYAVIAGIRWDTSSYGDDSGDGPRWRRTKRPSGGFSARHPKGL